MSAAVELLSLREFLARPNREDNQREELIDGELMVSPGAKVSHAALVGRLRASLALLEQRGYVLANDFACVLGGRSMPIPDLAAVGQDRWQSAADNDEWLAGSPELVIEHGAEQVWIVFPGTQTLRVVTPDGTTEARMGETVEFHGVRVEVALN